MANFNNPEELKTFVKEVLTKAEGAKDSLYRLSFAGTGDSGASFGLFQNDVAVNDVAKAEFRTILTQARNDARVALFTSAEVDQIVTLAGAKRVTAAHFTRSDLDRVNKALSSADGKRVIDDLDGRTLTKVTNLVNTFLGTVNSGSLGTGVFNRANPDPIALAAVVSWTNRSGEPIDIAKYMSGQALFFNGQSRKLLAAPTRSDTEFYLSNQEYFRLLRPNEFYGATSAGGWWKKGQRHRADRNDLWMG